MFKKLVALNAQSHHHLGLRPTSHYQFVADQIQIPIVYSEMADAAREFPIVFLANSPNIFILTGLQAQTNAYVAENGAWRAAYVPVILRNYPLCLVSNPQKTDSFVLALDLKAPQLSEETGDRLFLQGQPSLLLQQRLQQLELYAKDELLTHQFVLLLKKMDLLKEQAIRVQHNDQLSQLTGLLIIDEDKLKQLPNDSFNQLRQQGLLPFIYAHLLSLSNLRYGVLANLLPTSVPSPATPNNTTLNIQQDDIVRFNF